MTIVVFEDDVIFDGFDAQPPGKLRGFFEKPQGMAGFFLGLPG